MRAADGLTAGSHKTFGQHMRSAVGMEIRILTSRPPSMAEKNEATTSFIPSHIVGKTTPGMKA